MKVLLSPSASRERGYAVDLDLFPLDVGAGGVRKVAAQALMG